MGRLGIISNGKSFCFYGRRYKETDIGLKIGDKVMIDGKYKAIIVTHHVPSVMQGQSLRFETTNEICLRGIEENKDWDGKVVDQFEFDRLTFISR